MWTLLHYPLCPASRAIRLALNEAGIEAERTEVKPWAITRDFLNLNPAGTLPVLVIEGKAICGVYPIVEYLAETVIREGPGAARSGYWPGSAAERAEARRVAEWFLRKFDAEVSQYLLDEKLYKPMSRGGAPDLDAIRTGRGNLRYHLSYVSFLSEHRKWLGGDHPGFADLAAAAQLSAMDYLGEIPWGEFPEAKAWYARLKSRPSFRPLLLRPRARLQPAGQLRQPRFLTPEPVGIGGLERAPERERSPAFEVAALDKAETRCAIAGEDFACLALSSPDRMRTPPRRVSSRRRGASLSSGFARMFATTISKGARAKAAARLLPIANVKADASGGAVLAAIFTRDHDGDGVDIGGGGAYPVREGFGRGDGEHAGACTKIEHGARLYQRRQRTDGQQAALGRAVMRGAEGAARVDLDGPLRE